MAEYGKNDAPSVLDNNPDINNYKEIKPDEKISFDECDKIWKDLFSVDKLEELFDELVDSEDVCEYDENGTRELTEDEKQELKDKLGWSDEKINANCRIDADGVIHYKTDKQDLEGKESDCGVKYERKRFEYNGVIIEGVFPVFDSKFDTTIEEKDYQSSSGKQFSEANKSLSEAIENDPELKKQFTKEQLQDIANGDTPRGYTWHHNEEPGKMQLVKTPEHDKRIGGAAHTGGNSIWCNKSRDTSSNLSNKGVSF